MYKGIVIGCGKIGALLETDGARVAPRTHASTLAENPQTELAALVDTSEENLQKASSLFPNVPVYIELSKCLSGVKPDIAIVATTSGTHVPIVERCVEAKIPIIIGEKPLARDMDGALAIARAVKNSGVVFALNYQRRYFPLFIQAKERIALGEIGRIEKVECRYDNGLFNNGGHALDSVQFLLGERFASASGAANTDNGTHPEGDPNVDGEAITENGVRVILKSFDQKISPIHELHLSGGKGSLHIREYGYVFEWKDRDGSSIHTDRDRQSMTAGVLVDAIAAYEKKQSPESGIKNGLAVLSVLEALKASASRNGAPTKVVYTNVV